MDNLQAQLLGLVALDYESMDSIYSELCESIGYAPTDEEIAKGVKALIEKGLVAAYIYSAQKKAYEPIEHRDMPSLRQAWYMATSKGKEINADKRK